MKSDLVLTGGKIIDPKTGYIGAGTIHIADGKIEKVEKRKKLGKSGKNIVNLEGFYLCPGFIDMHVHLREPGREDEETIISGTDAAVAGGFTAVACMPNTDPALDSAEAIKFVIEKALFAKAKVYPVGAMTVGRKGETLAPMREMKDTGAVAFSDDGSGLQNNELMRRALEYAKSSGAVIISHCEFNDLVANGVMNEGYVSSKIGLRGIPSVAEELMAARDIMLAEYTGGRVHIAHVSTAGTVELIRRAKKAGIQATAEATPHHFTLTDDLLESYDTHLKVNPPIRTRRDVEAIKKGLREGVIDAIASDHAPHSLEEKELEFDYAPFGMIGLETSIGLTATELVKGGALGWLQIVRAMSTAPAEILRVPGGNLEIGGPADFTVIDPNLEWTVRTDELRSLSKNSPFIGRKLQGKAVMTIVDGRIVFSAL
jgi:dihydroorotase